MKKLVYTAISVAALSLCGGAYAAGGGAGGIGLGAGTVSGGHFDSNTAIIGGAIGGNYNGDTFSGMNGTSGVQSSLAATHGAVNSQALVVGGNIVGSAAMADFSNPTQPFQNSVSYQLGANFESASADSSLLGLGNSATVEAASFQNFNTEANTELQTGFVLGGIVASHESNWGEFDAAWLGLGAGFGGF